MDPYAATLPRLLTDSVYVVPASIVTAAIAITIRAQRGPDATLLAERVRLAIRAMVDAELTIGVALRPEVVGGAAYCSGAHLGHTVTSPPVVIDPGRLGAVYVPSVTVTIDYVG